MILSYKKAQSITEYALLLALVATAFVGMQIYVKRGLQGRLRDTSDFLVATMNQRLGSSYANQYEPNYRTTSKELEQESSLRQRMLTGGRKVETYQDTTQINQTDRIRQIW